MDGVDLVDSNARSRFLIRVRQTMVNGLTFSLIAVLVGSCTVSRTGVTSSAEGLPEELGTAVKTDNDQISVQVGVLTDEESRQFVGYPLMGQDVLAVYLRVQNLAPTRLLISGKNCHLFGKEGDEYVEIPRLTVGDVASEFDRSEGGYVAMSPLGFLAIPLLPLSITLFDTISTNIEVIELDNGVLRDNLLRVAWGKRTLGPGAIEKGLLFFDWDEAEEYKDELHLALDMRDLINDWHTVMPVQLTVR